MDNEQALLAHAREKIDYLLSFQGKRINEIVGNADFEGQALLTPQGLLAWSETHPDRLRNFSKHSLWMEFGCHQGHHFFHFWMPDGVVTQRDLLLDLEHIASPSTIEQLSEYEEGALLNTTLLLLNEGEVVSSASFALGDEITSYLVRLLLNPESANDDPFSIRQLAIKRQSGA